MTVQGTLESKTRTENPFQLLSAFTANDKDKFFGREAETATLYRMIQEANVVLVYGESGTGKTSLVQCGLQNETKHSNWASITVRRGNEISESLLQALKAYLQNNADGTEEESEAGQPDENAKALLHRVFLVNFQPVLLVFDQFEELFVFGHEAERDVFVANMKEIMKLRIPWKMVFVIRQDFLAQLDLLEKNFSGLFKTRMRVDVMTASRCREVVIKSCETFAIGLQPPPRKKTNGKIDYAFDEAAADVADLIVKTVADTRPRVGDVHLPYLQVFLGTLWKKASDRPVRPVCFTGQLVKEVGSMGNVLEAFLEEKVNAQAILSPVDAWKFLKLFVPEKGTQRKKVKLKEYTAVPYGELLRLVAYFLQNKIVAGCTGNEFELSHESLVPVIQNKKYDEIRKRLDESEITIKGNPYKGLQSFDAGDSNRFYGREEAKKAVIEKTKERDFLVIAGNSGAGKSSLVKAGLFPALEAEGYKILPPVRAGDKPVENIDRLLAEIRSAVDGSPAEMKDAGRNAFALLIDQYEELITRIRNEETRTAVYEKIHGLLEEQQTGKASYKLKIIVTVRADFEPQFRLKKPLDTYWKDGKYMVPPFSRDEIKEVIVEPAYQAGLEFSPPSLADEIADEVYNSQATGLLPLMSYTLSELYKAYRESPRKDHLLTREDYEKMGGVIGGLQNRADRIYQGFKVEHPRNYGRYQYVMQNVILRMVYISAGEFAGRRVSKEELAFTDKSTNKIKEEILEQLVKSHLITAGKDNAWYEPAHDVLVKSWAQVWVWIDNIGEDGINTRNGLARAVDEYEKSERHTSYLWDKKPKLDGLLSVAADAQNNWLNKREQDFILGSRQKKDEALAAVEADRLQKQREREEKIKLQQEKKFTEEKNGLLQSRYKRENTFKWIITGAFAVAAVFGIMAFRQAEITKSEKTKVLSLNGELSKKNDSLEAVNAANENLANKNREAAETATRGERKAKELAGIADSSAKIAKAERAKTLVLVAQLNASNESLHTSLEAEKTTRKQLDAMIQKLNAATNELDRVNKELQTANNSLNKKLQIANDSIKDQNILQLLATSKRLEQTDLVKAYRLAELAYRKDTANKEAAAQFNRLSQSQNYFYVREFGGDDARFSPDGNSFYTYNLVYQTLTRRDTQGLALRGQVKFKPGLISLNYSPDGLLVLAAYKNGVQLYYVNDSNRVEEISGKARNVFSTGFSPNPNVQKAFILTEDGLYVWQGLANAKAMPLPLNGVDEKLLSTRFSPDGQRLLCEGASGKVFILDALTGKLIKAVSKKRTESSFFDPKGKYFIVYAANGNSVFTKNILLFDSYGEKLSMPNLDKYGTLASATFSDDSSRVLLAFKNSSFPEQQQIQQKTDVASFETVFVLAELNNGKARIVNTEAINEFIGDGDVALLPDGSPNLIMSGNKLLTAQANGLIRMLNLSNGKVDSLAGHDRTVRSISLSGNGDYVLTSSTGSNTKLWRYDRPASLDAKGLLPQLSAEDLKKYGENK